MSRNKGMGGHQRAGSLKEEWITPSEVIEALGLFDLDPCAAISQPWPTATEHYTVADDGLVQPWRGRVWCNPPYGSKTSLWLRKLADHGNGTALIFARTETEMFFEQVWHRAQAIFFFRGRLHFCHVSGAKAAGNAGAPSCLVAYGQRNVRAIQVSGLPGRLVLLK